MVCVISYTNTIRIVIVSITPYTNSIAIIILSAISYTYTISQLASFEKRSLAIPIELTSLQDTTATLKINDLTTTLLETNLIFHDWPKE